MNVRLRLHYAVVGPVCHGDVGTEVGWLLYICLQCRLELWEWFSGLRYAAGNPVIQRHLAVGEDSMSLTASSVKEVDVAPPYAIHTV